VTEVPSNLLLNKIGKPAIYLPTAMVIWGVISACTAAAQSYAGMVAIRFFLGIVEVSLKECGRPAKPAFRLRHF